MKTIQFVNELIRKRVSGASHVVLFGQNISTGSCISGLTRNLQVGKDSHIINTPNCENTLTGAGFGMMLGGVDSIFFMKQLDFLLLGMDHLVNTYNFIRNQNPRTSFTIVPVVVDIGYQGMQSSFNSLGDLCSAARIDGFTVTNQYDAEGIISSKLISPGFRIIGICQRLFHQELLDPGKPVFVSRDKSIFQYSTGEEVTIACFNFSLPEGLVLRKKLEESGRRVSLFSVNSVTPVRWDKIIRQADKSKRLIVLDDSKCANLSCTHLLEEAQRKTQLKKSLLVKRPYSDKWFTPNPERLELKTSRIIGELFS